MSLEVFIISLALTGQLRNDDRYPTSPPPLTESPRQSNPSAPPTLRQPVAAPPSVTVENFGLGTARTTPPTTPVDARPGLKPAAMMRAMLNAPPGARLTGRPVTLAEVVAGAGSRNAQSQRIDAYWDLCAAVADYYLGLREQDEVQRLRSLATQVGPTWQQAEAELGVRIGTSQRAAVASQYHLANLMGGADASNLPLPGDMPHCGDYYVRYDQIFAGRASPEAQQLSELLPLRYEELKDAATAVTRAEQWLDTTANQGASASDGTAMLRALELLALRRRAFVQIARDYNQRIVRYTELATPGDIDADRLIGMLIKRDGPANTATRPAAPPPGRQTQTTSETPRTFEEDWLPAGGALPPALRQDNAVEPAAATQRQRGPRRERSLLVPSSR